MECLMDWPEPMVRVQSVSDSGETVIPDRYVKPPSERPTSPDTRIPDGDARVSCNIPTVDLAGLLHGASECRATMQQISDACKEWGFFQVVNHGICSDRMRRAMDVWREFFHLPMEAKEVYSNSPKTYEGYGSRLGVEKDAILDWGDYFFLHLLPLCIKSRDKWPALPTSCRDTIEAYGEDLTKLSRLLMSLLSVSCGLEAGKLQEAFGGEEAGACMRANFYSKCPQPELTLGLSAHSDPGGLTILLADDSVAGLQVRKGSEWVTVQPVFGSFIVNIGDQIQVLTNGIYKSVEHRVLVNSKKERLSIAFFYNPKSDVPIGPIKELVTPDKSAVYEPMTFNEYRQHIRKMGPRGKSIVESLKVV